MAAGPLVDPGEDVGRRLLAPLAEALRSEGRSGGAVLRSAGAGPLAPLPSPGLAGLRSGAGISESSFIVYLSLMAAGRWRDAADRDIPRSPPVNSPGSRARTGSSWEVTL